MNKRISRRAFLTSATVVGATAMLGAAGCSAQAAGGSADGAASDGAPAGTVFEGVGRGLKSDIRVAVRMDTNNQTIEDVSVVAMGDSPFISDAAAAGVPEAMVEYQALNVDAVAGATWTSLGIIAGVKDALSTGGVDISAFETSPVIDTVPGEDVDCDVLVIGGGAAGLSASIAAKTDDTMSAHADSGLNVIVVEQLGYTGGCIRVSDTMLWAPNNTRYNLAAGVATSDDDLIAYTKENPLNDYLNEDLWRNILGHIPIAFQSLLDRGLFMPVVDAKAGLLAPGLSGPYWQVRDQVTGEAPLNEPVDGFTFSENSGGPYLAQSLEYCAIDAGVDIRKSTQVDELILTDKLISGVHVTDKANHTQYTIHPKQIVLATGCLGANSEMVYGLNPAATDAIHFGCAGTTGDGINWVKDHDGVVLEGLIHYVSGPDSRLGHYGPCSILREYAPRVTVNLDGERFVNEGATSIGATAAAANDTEDNTAERLEAESVGTYLEQKDNKGFAIMSGTDIETFQKQLDYAIDHDVAWRADSLEDLANQTGINIEGLTKTIADYNAAYAAGEGSDFGITNEFMTPIAETGPYYAFMMRTLYNLMDYGVQVNSDCQPITVDGSLVFDNVQTAGSIMVSNYSFMWGGISHSTALTSGSYVGNLARHRVLG